MIMDGLGLVGLVLIALGTVAALLYRPASRRFDGGRKLDGGAVFPPPAKSAPRAPGVDAFLRRVREDCTGDCCRGRAS